MKPIGLVKSKLDSAQPRQPKLGARIRDPIQSEVYVGYGKGSMALRSTRTTLSCTGRYLTLQTTSHNLNY